MVRWGSTTGNQAASLWQIHWLSASYSFFLVKIGVPSEEKFRCKLVLVDIWDFEDCSTYPMRLFETQVTIASSQSNYRTKITIAANKVKDVSAGNTPLKLLRKPPLKNGMQCAFFFKFDIIRESETRLVWDCLTKLQFHQSKRHSIVTKPNREMGTREGTMNLSQRGAWDEFFLKKIVG